MIIILLLFLTSVPVSVPISFLCFHLPLNSLFQPFDFAHFVCKHLVMPTIPQDCIHTKIINAVLVKIKKKLKEILDLATTMITVCVNSGDYYTCNMVP